MRVLIQRVRRASVYIGEDPVASIGRGLLVFVAFRTGDREEELRWMAEKVVHLRIFGDDAGKMNRSLLEVGGEALVVSQFTLYGDARKGRRPGFDAAAPPSEARVLFEKFVDKLRSHGIQILSGKFQTSMLVELVNDGPVTILVDSPAAGFAAG